MSASNIYLQCRKGPRGVGSYTSPPSPFKELFASGKIEQLELLQDANMGGTYVRCFYKVNDVFYQNTPFDYILKPKFEDDKNDSSGAFLMMKGDPKMIAILEELYKQIHSQPFIVVYAQKS